ncbi:MAG: Crp/Fnr family transcriptional regulator [Planctomycetota bacterium]|nr:Crp/Fnr family transcriptional regulator [Planctomycetota bacterium]
MSRLLEMSQIRRFQRGQIIFRQDDPCPGVFIVGSGLVRVYRISPAGREHVLHLVSPGATFAEVATIGSFDCPAFAEALEDTVCLLLPADRFSRALREDHQLCLQLMASMAGWVKHLLGLVEDITLRDAIGRVARYLLAAANGRNGRVQLPSLKKHLASHLNLTSETLSRTLRRLMDMELIEATDEQGLVVKDHEQLAVIAQGE